MSVSDGSEIGAAAASERRTAVTHLCSVGEGDGKPASAYCKDCGKLMCREHEEVKKSILMNSWIIFHLPHVCYLHQINLYVLLERFIVNLKAKVNP